MNPQEINPAAGWTADGVRVASRAAERPQTITTAEANKAVLTVGLDDGALTVRGRLAQTLRLLIQRGPRGFTSGEASPLGWARRTSHYVHQLRRMGIPILTLWEKAGDARVGRYVLTRPLQIVEPKAGGLALGSLEEGGARE